MLRNLPRIADLLSKSPRISQIIHLNISIKLPATVVGGLIDTLTLLSPSDWLTCSFALVVVFNEGAEGLWLVVAIWVVAWCMSAELVVEHVVLGGYWIETTG